MNRILAVPNWSFFDPGLANTAADRLGQLDVKIHYCQGDIDHQRTVIAFSGPSDRVFEAATELAQLLLPKVNLQIQAGIHPRVGALDVMPFVLIEGSEKDLISECRDWATSFLEKFEVPYHLYEKAAYPGTEHSLPYLRGQMSGALVPLEFNGPIHPAWGYSVIGVRDFLLAANIDVDIQNPRIVKQVARDIRNAREEGLPQLSGVRALGFELRSRGLSQLSLNLTRPDLTDFDHAYEFAQEKLADFGAKIVSTELIGVIRTRDLPGAKYLKVEPSQVVF